MKLTISIFTAIALLGCSGYADDTNIDEENVIVDSRPLPPKKKLLMEKQREAEEKAIEDEETEVAGLKIPIHAQNSIAGLIIPIKKDHEILLASNALQATATSYSPYLYHWIDAFPQDSIVKMEDGTEWAIDQDVIGAVRNWRVGDTIVISPKFHMPWSSNHPYILTNKDLGESVNVNPFLGPVKFGPNTTWVANVDFNSGQIYLYNGQGERTIWEVSSSDLYLLKEWQNNDSVIIGENDSFFWWFSSYNHILINVNMNHYIRARQVSGPGMRG